MNIIVTGSLSFDFIMDFHGRFADRIMPDKIHSLSLSFLADKLTKQFGGTAGNIAYSLKLLGLDPTILASAGNDFEPYKEFLARHGISFEHIQLVKHESTSTYFAITDKDDNQIGSFYSGAMKENKNLSLGSGATFVVISPQDPESMVKFVDECNTQSIPYLYDPAFQIETFTTDQLKHGIVGADIVIGNDYEISLMEKKLEIPHEELVIMAGILITTLGSKGSVIETRTQQMHVKPSKPNNTSDPTGAGDAYRGGFLAGYLRKFDLTVCAQMGSVAAVYTVEKYGTMTHSYTIEEFQQRYLENYGEKLLL